ncbi:hypothetical protein H5410_040330 [Solanum commersonii]|uniref:Uncharacterized protein n=1 Tax=Solanum commersonii TaxID=4109 RepID=A0A9J5XRR1_SOLCO|nr:hypothetical protein H5410_040330 [Solanum commersonii]
MAVQISTSKCIKHSSKSLKNNLVRAMLCSQALTTKHLMDDIIYFAVGFKSYDIARTSGTTGDWYD